MSIISKSEAARLLGISKQSVQQWKDEPFFIEVNGKIKIDDTHPEWINKLNAPKWTKKNKSISNGAIKRESLKKALSEDPEEIEVSSQLKSKEGGRFFRGALRQSILQRDNFKCVLCGKTPADGVRLEIDHIVKFEEGGKTNYENGQTVCSECNKGKHQQKKISDSDEYISQLEFARRVGAHRNTIAEAITKGIIDNDQTTGNINYTTEVIRWYESKAGSGHYTPPEQTPEIQELTRQAAIAEMQDTIYAAEIKKQKAEQEKLKTLEQKKDLANIHLLIHFFSFAENIIQRWYRRPHELSPQLSALYLAGEEKKAEQLLLKELEGIIKETQKDLIKALEEEGLKISEYN